MVFVVAEIGVNWDGNYDLAGKMMKNAKDAGCNAVKFQAYQETMVQDHPQKLRLIKSAISKSNVQLIDDLAKSVGIEWFCTPMYPDAVDFLNPFVKRFKIREIDGRPLLESKTSELIERILKTDKEIFVSSQKPHNKTVGDNSKIKWLYVVPKYPCNLMDLNFREIKNFDGYSNHCPHFLAPLTAVILGAKIIEVHITDDKSGNFIDNNVSFNYDELKHLIELIHLSKKITV